jgi:diguanylate cyclase (GGDEF)-like protein
VPFRDTPIRQKLITISLISSAAALLLACATLAVYELAAYREATLHKLTAVAGVIAANSSAALSFDDRESAEETLSALRAENLIITACIYTADGRPFAAYHRDSTKTGCEAGLRENTASDASWSNALALSFPIRLEGEEIGSIAVLSDPIDLHKRLLGYGSIAGIVMLLAGLVSLPLASKLQRFISDPILQLVATSRRVSAEKDFSVRAISHGKDELGVLVGAFNDMLEQIEMRDGVLARYRVELEEEVDRRTGELRQVNEELKRQIAQRENAEERIRRLAYYDGLTGLPNRQLFQEHLEKALATARAVGAPIGLLFIDLDRFKQVNDTLGHSAGDELLWSEVSRLGGDEFTILLTAISDAQDAAKVAQRVLDELSRPLPVGGYELFTTASIGIAVYPFDGDDPETLLRNADTAMYHAKSRQRNNFQFYTEEMNVTASRKLQLASRLRHALEQGQFSLHYQPLRAAVGAWTMGAEALLRWRDPELGPVSPEEFIPIAEDTGLIAGIGDWVLRTACEQVAAWQAEGYQSLRIAVNVSSHQLRQPGWRQTVARTLEETGLSPAQLELEVTETAILQNDDVTRLALRELDDMGVGLCLDDFGTGYSSLSYLRRFPIHRVKIDRSFVGDITADPDDAAITSAILAMAQSLRLPVVAEGVETLEQAEFLRERGCDELQGYLFSKPVPPNEFVRFLEREKTETSA